MGYLYKAKQFLEGAISMVKKKFKEGINFFDLLVNDDEIDGMLKPLVFSYRAFGNFSEGNIEAALADYNTLKVKHQLSPGDEYNLLLCEGIMAANENRWNTARQKFEWAGRMNPSKIEPRFYLAVLSIISFISEHREHYDLFLARPDSEQAATHAKKLTLVVYEALETLEVVLSENDSCPNLIFYLGYLKLAIGLHNDAIENFAVAIEKSDDNQSVHFVWKGIALCMSDNYEEALNEFRIALNIKTTSFQAALFKGRCYLHKKDIERAMYAFKDFIEGSSEEEQEIKYFLGNFFFHNGLPSHARQVYEEAVELKSTERSLRELTKVYIVEKNLFLALDKLEVLNEDFPHNSYKFDLSILLALRSASSMEFKEAEKLLLEASPCSRPFIFTEIDQLFYLGLIYFYSGKYKEALTRFNKAQSLKYPSAPNEEEEEVYLSAIFSEDTEDDSSLVGQTFTYLEIKYNIAMCHLMLGNQNQCLTNIDPLVHNANTSSRASGLVEILKSGVNTDAFLNIFPFTNRLCGIFEEVTVALPSSESAVLNFRLSFCLPSVELPSTEIKVGLDILDDLRISSVENKPEAPWIKRTEEGIIFTSELISTEASEVRDVGELLAKIAANKNEMVNTKIKLNAEKIFESYQWKELKEISHREGENKLLRLKEELMLDPKTMQALEKISKNK